MGQNAHGWLALFGALLCGGSSYADSPSVFVSEVSAEDPGDAEFVRQTAEHEVRGEHVAESAVMSLSVAPCSRGARLECVVSAALRRRASGVLLGSVEAHAASSSPTAKRDLLRVATRAAAARALESLRGRTRR